ncbi:GNAT family N-acetyltransferase [Cohnella faecalis]|uniref:GNAT family N-acetyltransferase n=1 Tax=Cohnella faecalis TaxID=2315694 RepID=UPI0026B60411|nr:hypothetical protein [Cohnella faecalis]
MSAFIFPELETGRLRLSILTLNDSAAVYKHFSDENVTRFMDIDPCKDIQEAKEIIQYHIDDTGSRWAYSVRLILNLLEPVVSTVGFRVSSQERR